MAFTKIAAAGIGSTELVTLHSLEVLNNATVGGVLTYEDVTNVDSVGLITARNGIVVGSGITLSKDGDGFFTGIVTATSYYGDGSNLSNITSTTINNNADNRLITGSGTANTLNGESNVTYDGSTLQIATDANLEGFKIISSGDTYSDINISANRGSANNSIGRIKGLWNDTQVASIEFKTGADTSGKDDGEITFHTSNGGGTLDERVRIFQNGSVVIGSKAGEAGGDAKLAIDCQGMDIYDGVGDASNYGLIFANDSTNNKANGIGFFNDSASTCGGYIVHQDKGSGNIGDLVFGTSATSDTPVERLRISSAGDVTVADGDLIFGANGNALDFQNQTIESTTNYNRTVTAEKIDYYEEGYLDPTAISAGLTWETTGNRQLRYVRIGNWVSVSGYLQLVSRTSNSNVIKVAMPFTSAPNSSGYYTRGVGAAMHQNVTLTTNYTNLVSYVGGGENYMRFFQLRSGHGWQQLMNSNLGSDSTTAIYFSINYMVA